MPKRDRRASLQLLFPPRTNGAAGGASADVPVSAAPDDCQGSHAQKRFTRTSPVVPQNVKKMRAPGRDRPSSHLDRLVRDIRSEARSFPPPGGEGRWLQRFGATTYTHAS